MLIGDPQRVFLYCEQFNPHSVCLFTLLKNIKGACDHHSITQAQLNRDIIETPFCPTRKNKLLSICFGANKSDNRCTGEASTRHPPKRGKVLQVVA